VDSDGWNAPILGKLMSDPRGATRIPITSITGAKTAGKYADCFLKEISVKVQADLSRTRVFFCKQLPPTTQ